MKDKNLFEGIMNVVFILLLLLVAGRTFGQHAELISTKTIANVSTTQGTITCIKSGHDSVMLKWDGHAGKVYTEHLEKAGSIDKQFYTVIAMADDASCADNYTAAYRCFLKENDLRSSAYMVSYFAKCWKVRKCVLKVLPKELFAELAFRVRQVA